MTQRTTRTPEAEIGSGVATEGVETEGVAVAEEVTEAEVGVGNRFGGI
jgi:hypothetical protein